MTMTILYRTQRKAGKFVQQVVMSQPLVDSVREECKELRKAVSELRKTCSQLPALPTVDKGSALSLLLRERQLQVELAVWQELGSYSDGNTTQEDCRGKLEETMAGLEASLEAIKLQKEAARGTLAREKKWLEETRLLMGAVEGKLEEEVGARNSKRGEESGSQSLKNKLERSQQVSEALWQNIESFIEGHLTLSPDEGGSDNRTSKSKSRQTTLKPNRADTRLTLTQFIKELIERTLTFPHEPYLPRDGLAQDHFLLLLRSGVIQKHPDNHTLVKITPFHH